MKQNENAFWNWLLTSSADPEKYSLTAKGIVSFVIPFLLTFLPAIGIHIRLDAQTTPDLVYSLVMAFFLIVSTIASFVGLVRKLANSLKIPPQA